MTDEPNEKTQLDRTGLTVNTDPAQDAEQAAQQSKSDKSMRAPRKGVTRIGGGDHGKADKGVKIVKRP